MGALQKLSSVGWPSKKYKKPYEDNYRVFFYSLAKKQVYEIWIYNSLLEFAKHAIIYNSI